jgi:hypothetical protein
MKLWPGTSDPLIRADLIPSVNILAPGVEIVGIVGDVHSSGLAADAEAGDVRTLCPKPATDGRPGASRHF